MSKVSILPIIKYYKEIRRTLSPQVIAQVEKVEDIVFSIVKQKIELCWRNNSVFLCVETET